MRRVAIIHPWYPAYRRTFFRNLVAEAAKRDVVVDIFYGETPPEWVGRGDSLTPEDAVQLPTRWIKVGPRNLAFKNLEALRRSGPYDLVVAEQAVRNLELYQLLISRRYGRVALWGHGRTFTVSSLPLQARLKRLVTRRVCWFFAYTPSGKRAVSEAGFDQKRVTVVYNSIDTSELQAHLAQLDRSSNHDLRVSTGLLYVGGLDSSKRIKFLLSAFDHIAKQVPSATLVIAGDGDDRGLVEAAAKADSRIQYVGPVQGAYKASLLANAALLLNPGRVGLVAVDSLVSGVPIVTTNWPYHAPEFEYLTPGQNAAVSDNTVAAYGKLVTDLLTDAELLASMRRACRANADRVSIDAMVTNFLDGILGALAYVQEEST